MPRFGFFLLRILNYIDYVPFLLKDFSPSFGPNLSPGPGHVLEKAVIDDS